MNGIEKTAGCLTLLVMLGFAAWLGYPYVFGNKKIFDTGYNFKYADIHFPDGQTKTLEVVKWKDYDGEQIQIWAADGTVYLVSSFNTILRSK